MRILCSRLKQAYTHDAADPLKYSTFVIGDFNNPNLDIFSYSTPKLMEVTTEEMRGLALLWPKC